MPNITGHTELVGLMAYPIRHTQSPTTHNLAYDKNGDDVIQLAFEVDNDSLEAAVNSIRALKMLGSNISMPNKTVVHKYLEEVDEAAQLCGAINTVVNMRDENGQVTGRLKGYNTDGMGYWQGIKEEGIEFKGMKMVLIGTGGAATAIAVRGALDGIAELHIFNIKDKFYARGEEIVEIIKAYEYLDNTTFISFDINNLISLRKICPNQKAQYLTVEFSNEILENLKKYKLDLDIEYHNINNDILPILKENNIEVNCWTCNDSEAGEKLVECGVDYITSNILE